MDRLFFNNYSTDLYFINNLRKANETVRIQSIVLNNIKSVNHGEIVFTNLKKSTNHRESSNILGLYGQNGSGKTTVIETLYILKKIMSGEAIFSSDIERFFQGKKADIEINTTFEIQRNGSSNVELVTYTVKLGYTDEKAINPSIKSEVISLCIKDYNGKLIKKSHKLFDTNSSIKTINGSVHSYEIVNDNTLEVSIDTRDYSQEENSIPFDDNIISRFFGSDIVDDIIIQMPFVFGNTDDYYEEDSYSATLNDKYYYLAVLKHFAEYSFYIVGGNMFNAFTKDSSPIYLRTGYIKTYSNKSSKIDFEREKILTDNISRLNSVLKYVIPGLELTAYVKKDFKEKKQKYFEEKEKAFEIDRERLLNGEKLSSDALTPIEAEGKYDIHFFTKRNGIEIPLSNESEGIKRIIYALDLVVAAYNNPSITVAIDEFDAGIFEYLLGEILQIFEDSGKGQLIFTCHNLRPLEVISRKSICFTTTNPNNRYIRLKYVGNTNNLRDLYFREILMNEQDEELYGRTKRYELVDAFRKAGLSNE